MTAADLALRAPGSAAPTPESVSPGLTAADLVRRRDLAQRLVADDAVVVGDDASGGARHLTVDPLPLVVTGPDWARLEQGLVQRARLLDLVLDDLYGERDLIGRGLLPAELVVGHPGFLAAADKLPTRHGLYLTATDLGRAQDGAWHVVADRAETAVGAGYAMAVRRIVARTMAELHRDTDLRRLRGFFDQMRTGLRELAPHQGELPRVVMLTAGGSDQATFDEAFTAGLLGFPVVHPDDLMVNRAQVLRETTGRPEPVDVVVRRVPGNGVDSLDRSLGTGSGVPGLLEASRRGVVTVVNPLGAGVLESPALGAYLPGIASALLGEDLLVPHARTWWCGDATSRREVLARFDDLLISPLHPHAGLPRVVVADLTAQQRADLLSRIQAEPWAWSGQEVLPWWTAPVVTDAGLAARPCLLRTFTVAGADGAAVMPGGLARVAPPHGSARIPSLADSVVKDVWVLRDDETDRLDSDPAQRADQVGQSGSGRQPDGFDVALSPRAAADLYWFGRYAERGESIARLLTVADDLVEDHLGRRGTAGHRAMQVLLEAVDALSTSRPERTERGTIPARAGDDTGPVAHLRTLVHNREVRGTLRHSVRRAARAAGGVRQLLPGDTWLILGRLDRTLEPTPGTTAAPLQPALASAVESFLALAGIGAESLVRDASWAFFDAGRRVERAQESVRLLQLTLTAPLPPKAAAFTLDAVLRSRDSLISHRRRMADPSVSWARGREVAVDLLLTDATNPRSVRFQLDRLAVDLRHAPSPRVSAALAVVAGLLEASPSVDDGEEGALDHLLSELDDALAAVAAALESTSLRPPQRTRTMEEPG